MLGSASSSWSTKVDNSDLKNPAGQVIVSRNPGTPAAVSLKGIVIHLVQSMGQIRAHQRLGIGSGTVIQVPIIT